ncbi:MAG: hypothetical protein PVF43_07595 [Candidatus Eiseniibacteriota bacterium]|jgi:CheY-like chemotaxis protein
MSTRIAILHWHAGEGAERAARLRRAGYAAELVTDPTPASLRALRDDPPAACIIDLERRPATGRDVAIWLRQQSATRRLPLVFAAGEEAATRRVTEQLPDAVVATWRGIRGALRRALAHPPQRPVVPRPMEGYASTPLPQKLGLRDGSVVALLDAPDGFERTLGPLPEGVRLRRQARGRADVVVLFVRTGGALERRFPAAVSTLVDGGRLWIAWPKRGSGVASDLSQNVVRRYGLARKLVDYKICSIDATWSGLCFARRARRRGSGRASPAR